MKTFRSEKTRLNLSNAELAKHLCCSTRTIRRLLAGTKPMTKPIWIVLQSITSKPKED
jgi:hypothetical protein